jgi:cytochrome c-type biogenesis protein CcmH
VSTLVLLLALALQAPGPQSSTAGPAVAAQDAELEALTRKVASELRCPVCQGLSIEDSPSEQARNMRDVVRDQLAQGRTPEQVKAYFVERYSEWILLAPKPRGFNLAVYVLPILAVLAGAAVVWVLIRRWSRPDAAAVTDAVLMDEPEMAAWEESSSPR